jgi:hypothetical protein
MVGVEAWARVCGIFVDIERINKMKFSLYKKILEIFRNFESISKKA